MITAGERIAGFTDRLTWERRAPARQESMAELALNVPRSELGNTIGNEP